jgi:polysaccharide pyruvyl transferase CsaB
MEQVLVVGYFGAGNLGDEAILEGISTEFRRRRPGLRVAATRAGDRWIKGGDVEPVSLFDVDAISAAVSDSSAVLFGCGGVFQDYWGAYESSLFKDGTNGIEAYVRPALLARLRGVPAVLFSAGIGPLGTSAGRQMVALGCAGLALASVRDEASRAALEETGVGFSPTVSADPAYLLRTTDEAKARVRRRLVDAGVTPGTFVQVTVRSWPFGPEPERLADRIAAGLRALPPELPLLFVPFHVTGAEDDDVLFARRVQAVTGRGALFEVADVDEALAVSGEARLVLAGRNHAAIFAHLAGTPFVALAYDPKVAAVADSAGTRIFSLRLEELDRLGDRLLSALSARDALAFELHASVDALRERASVPFSAVEEILERRGAALPGAPAFSALESLAISLQEERDGRRVAEHLVSTLQSEAASLRESLRREEAAKGQLAETLGHREQAAAYLAGREAALRSELAGIHASRLWKLGLTWWRFLDLVRGVLSWFGGAKELPRPMPAAGPAVESVEAPDEPPAGWSPAFLSGIPSGNRHDVVCFPIIDWDFRFQRPQQLMKQFGAAGHRVFYVSQSFRSEGRGYELKAKAPNVWEVSLRGPARNVYKDALSEADVDELLASLDELRRGEGLGATASVVQLPFWWPVAEQARARLAWPVVYDCMDFHAGFSTNEEAMLERERSLVAGADLVAVSSAFLEREVAPSARRIVRVPNACEYWHFASVAPRPSGPRPVVGYYGAISDWFDADLVADLAERRPDWDFLLVGSTFGADVSRLSALPNVRLPGEVAYKDVPGWISRMDVLVIPFRRTPLTEATNPVKAYEILAAGRPLVSVPLPEVVALGSLVRIASDVAEFVREITAALGERSAGAVEERRAFARRQTWEARFESLSAEVAGAFPKVSIAIVTYNNLDWNRTCLKALFGRTEWPNMEVFVVDNASVDGTREFLAEAERLWPGLKVILNESNEGFARANNRALASASGEILVLLNNDTAVSRGWLSSLARHLLSDRTIGLVGPVTNEIGNEARITVGYRDLAGMPAWAAELTAKNDGQLVSLSSLAMFCLALRRDVWERLGPLDESFGTGMFEDDDFALRARELGLRTVCALDSFVHHAGGASFRKLSEKAYQDLFDRNRDLFEAKWGAWHPHLSKEHRDEAGRIVEELRRRRAVDGVKAGRTLLVLSAGRNEGVASHLLAVARAAGAGGWFVVLDRSGSPDAALASLRPEGGTVWSYTGAEDRLANLAPDVVWATPVSAVSALQFDSARVVYDLSAGAAALAEGDSPLFRAHRRLLDEAVRIVGERGSGAGSVGNAAKNVTEVLDGMARTLPKPVAPLSPRMAGPDRAPEGRQRKGIRPPSGPWASRFQYQGLHDAGFCIACGNETLFTFSTPSLYRESLVCACCGATSRYRAIARGLLRFLRERAFAEASSLAGLAAATAPAPIRVYDAQVAFAYAACAYPLPEILGRVPWLRIRTSVFRPSRPWGEVVGPGVTNENLERLSFADSSLDVVIASDVLEHIRRDDLALKEIHRVLSPGGAFLFTVPHVRTMRETLIRRLVVDPEDPSKDLDVLPPEYHGDANSETGGGALAYRVYGTDLDSRLDALGFDVRYDCEDDPRLGIRNAELFTCVRRV